MIGKSFRSERLRELDQQETSDQRRELSGKLTEIPDDFVPHGRNIRELDKLLRKVASDYSASVCRPQDDALFIGSEPENIPV